VALRRIPFVGFVLGLVTVAGHAFAQQPAPQRGPQNPVEAAQQAAKDAAEFEFLGTLARTSPRGEVLRLLRRVIRRKRGKALIEAVWNIERVGNVQELRSLLRA
jgi:hypothetical protein